MKQALVEKLLALALEDDKQLSSDIPFEVGEKYFFRTVTYFATGRVKKITGKFIELGDASWVADTGRFREAIMEGTLNEVEPVDVPMFLNTDSIVDAFVWKHGLPRKQI